MYITIPFNNAAAIWIICHNNMSHHIHNPRYYTFQELITDLIKTLQPNQKTQARIFSAKHETWIIILTKWTAQFQEWGWVWVAGLSLGDTAFMCNAL